MPLKPSYAWSLALLIFVSCSDDSSSDPGSSQIARGVGQCITAELPTQLEAEDYCGFNESTPASNSGAAGSPNCDRGDGVDTQTTIDEGSVGNCNIGWTTAGEYLDYQLNSPGGDFEIILRAASNTGIIGRELSVSLDGVTVGSVIFDGTGWQSFVDLSVATVSISAGSHDLRVTFVNGSTNLNHLELVAAGAPSETVLLDEDFASGAGGFVYADDAFRGTNNPAYASGSATGGVLQAAIGGINGTDITDGMSAGWSASFTVPTSGSVDITFDYSVTFPCAYEPNELGQVLFAIDGNLIGDSGPDYVVQRDGGANCNDAAIGGQAQHTMTLAPGTHTIALGGYNNQKTTASEQLTVTFDNVRITAASAGAATCSDGIQNQDETDVDCGGSTCAACGDGLACLVDTDCTSGQCVSGTCQAPGATTLINANFDGGSQGFTYADDTFRGTANPAYAAGATIPGAIQVVVGGLDNADINGMSGGWGDSFSLSSATTVDISFDYTVTYPCVYEPAETGQILLSIDGSLIGDGGDAVFDRDGGTGCNDAPLAGSFSTSVDLGAGSHELIVGAYNSLKTYNNELMTVTFDNVLVVAADAPAATCSDGIQNQDEADVDCGGACPACADGLSCSVDADCASGQCTGGICVAPATCTDGIQNQDETDVDCGGVCPACADGLSCSVDADCAGGQCTGGVCVTPSGCSNGAVPAQIEAEDYCAFNESTPAVNSGAANFPQCDRGDGVDMEATVDDNTPNCNIGWTVPGEYWEYNVVSPGGGFEIILRAASNNGGLARSLEVTVDGVVLGSVTYDGTGWQSFADYSVGVTTLTPGPHTIRVTSLSGNTNFNHLELIATGPSCSDGLQNQDETDVDCGGSTCGGCSVGNSCLVDSDCISQTCANNTCQPVAAAINFMGEYYAGTSFGTLVTTRSDAEIDFGWGTGSPAPGVPADGFSVRWTGTIVPEFSESYTFYVDSDDGARLLIDGVPVIDDFAPRGRAVASGGLLMTAGQAYEVTLEYLENAGSAQIRFEWQSPSLSRRVVKPTVTRASGLDTLAPFSAFMGGVLPSTTPGQSTGVTTAATSNNLGVGMLLSMARPASSSLLYIGSRDGRIETVDPSAAPGSGTPFMDISGRVWTGQDSGLLGMTFHPEFGQAGSPNRGYFYLYYVTQIGSVQFIRLSRFTQPDGASVGDPNSELILIQQRLGPTLHRGGGLLFGLDGFLYLSIGDLGWRDRTQSITDIFIGGVLRIDVDQDPTRSHPIVTQLQPSDPDSFTQGYFIPDSNPWVGQPNVLEEFYSIGCRNPHRMSIDSVTGRILIGNVGSNTNDGIPTSHEEINEVEAGANFGWPFREAYADFAPRPDPLIGNLKDPNFAYPRSTGACIIGGHVYRGTALPQLYGRYILGDCTNNRVWAMADDAGNGPQEILLTAPASPVTTFGIDGNGEIYLGGGGSTVYRLAPSGPAVADPPTLLSQTGAFADLATLEPATGFIPYGMSNPLWSDDAAKLRWVGVPNDGNANTVEERITAAATGDWAFPVGSVFIKHFELPATGGSARRIETRFLVHGTDGRYWGVTYRWLPDGSDATLLTDGLDEEIDGQVWHYPSRSECLQCHNTTANQVLGLRTAQLNRPLYYPTTGATSNQLDTLSSLGLFETSLGVAASLPAAKSNHTLSATLETRVKSYLSSNCAHCHRPGGQGRGTFDTQFDTPMSAANIIDGGLAEDLGIPGARVIAPQNIAASVMYQRMNAIGGPQMPPLARNVVHTDALQLFAEWISAANTSPGPAAPTAQSAATSVATGGQVVITLTGADADGDALDFAIRTSPSYGTLSGVGDQITYTPNAGYTGPDSFTFVAYDGSQLGPEATVNITVTP